MDVKKIIVTPNELLSLAVCSKRMTDYVTADDKLLIVRLTSTDGTPVNLYLDVRCVCSRDPP